MTTTESVVDVGASEDIPERGRLIVEIGNSPEPIILGIFRFNGELYAWQNICAHQGGPACQGRIVSRVSETLDEHKRSQGLTFDDRSMHIVCPWHGFEYDVTTGRHPGRPDLALRAFPVSETGGRVRVTL